MSPFRHRLTSPRAVALAALLAALASAAPAPLAAQAADAAPWLGKSNVISINPLALLLTGISGEFEHRLGPSRAVAFSASVWRLDDYDYTAADAKLRFYPNGEALRGFSVAGGVGYTSVDGSLICFDACDQKSGAVSVGIELNHQWLLGATDAFAVTLGGGAKRLFYVSGDRGNASIGVPTIRISLGYAY